MSVPPNGSLGSFTIAPVPNSSPSEYQAVALENNQTIYNTVGTDHVPPGSSTNAGYHNQVTFVPQASVPAGVNGIWQVVGQGANLYLVPPNGTGVAQQLNSSAMITSGTYWSQSQTIANAPPITVYYYCPLGSSAITVTVQLTYSTAVLAQATVFVPYLDSSGNAFSITTPTVSFGIGALLSNGGGSAYATAIGWGVFTAAGNVGAGVGAYSNGIVMIVGKSFTTTASVVVSGSMTGVM
jgi:hypothetical protein